jgi:hypothetical protein
MTTRRSPSPRRGAGASGAVTGAGLVAATRTMHEPWPTVVALVAPVIPIAWAVVHAAVMVMLDERQERRNVERIEAEETAEEARTAAEEARSHARLMAELSIAKVEAAAMGPGEARARVEAEIRDVEMVIALRRLIIIKKELNGGDSPSTSKQTPQGAKPSSRSKAGAGVLPQPAEKPTAG